MKDELVIWHFQYQDVEQVGPVQAIPVFGDMSLDEALILKEISWFGNEQQGGPGDVYANFLTAAVRIYNNNKAPLIEMPNQDQLSAFDASIFTSPFMITVQLTPDAPVYAPRCGRIATLTPLQGGAGGGHFCDMRISFNEDPSNFSGGPPALISFDMYFTFQRVK